ncbi:hypothetical protein FRB96_008297 [Tulasnella sp. 330]|nr:hypothetical protein FRB96_008297 [Tulasnella sp. 330]KAG8886165.1 hypothetical protein FRB97_007203 [Tulasnella sp. 331]KAG8890433.1 hypothetical protein FRB98_008468 [Tulasnella sp. 332]
MFGSKTQEPPSYDVATGSQPGSSTGGSPQMNQRGVGYKLTSETKATDNSSVFRDPYPQYPEQQSMSSYDRKGTMSPRMPPQQLYPAPIAGPASTTVYHYQHPRTGHVITSLLPPNHPEMICLQAGEHIEKSKFGPIGVLAAIFWFPLGIGLCLLDRKIKCRRCGQTLQRGFLD